MIYILPLNEQFQPLAQPFRNPAHNADYGVEQDFLNFLNINPQFVTQNPQQAAYHYLPVFWTRWQLSNMVDDQSLAELQSHISQAILDESKTFTICQTSSGPLFDLGKAIFFLASRRTDQERQFDIPLLCSPHPWTSEIPAKKYLASFAGYFSSHPIREEMYQVCKDREDISIRNDNLGEEYFVKTMLESYISLCPRGYGGSSFRFFESMQLGVVPFLIGDLDTRPFKKYINWDKCSFYLETPAEMLNIIDKIPQKQLLSMGEKSLSIWENELSYGKWCKYVIKTLKDLK